MQVEEAIASAKTFFQQVFAQEQFSQVRLEEVEYDEAEHAWLVTLSAVQPPQILDRRAPSAVQTGSHRTYKSVKIDDSGARLPSVKIRQICGEV